MAKSKSVSLYLTERTMSAMRGGEGASGRINQIVDRYLQLMKSYQHDLRAEFSDGEWQRLRTAYSLGALGLTDLVQICRVLVDALDDSTELAARVDALSIAELAGLFELVEADLMSTPLPTHS